MDQRERGAMALSALFHGQAAAKRLEKCLKRHSKRTETPHRTAPTASSWRPHGKACESISGPRLELPDLHSRILSETQ